MAKCEQAVAEQKLLKRSDLQRVTLCYTLNPSEETAKLKYSISSIFSCLTFVGNLAHSAADFVWFLHLAPSSVIDSVKIEPKLCVYFSCCRIFTQSLRLTHNYTFLGSFF